MNINHLSQEPRMPSSKYDSPKHHRRSIRLKHYDYSQSGAYFVTICTRGRQCLFGEIIDGDIALNELGEIVQQEWELSEQIREEIEIGPYVVMPNHFHAIVIINACRGDRPVTPTPDEPRGPRPKSLSSLMAGFKSSVTKRINQLLNTPGTPLWQRDYYDRIIRSEKEYEQTALYILNNPQNWEADEEYFVG
jgi:REP element-mobilizing transposase RayT